jgi:hypothetical protein
LVPDVDLVDEVDEVDEVEPVPLREPWDPELRDVPDEADDVEGLAAVAMGVVALCAWKPSTAAVPKTVAEMTIGARLTVGCSSECE